MSRLNEIQHNVLRNLIGNRCFSKPVLAINAGGAATIKTTVVPAGGIVFTVDGVSKLKANLAAEVLATLAAVQREITGLDGYYVQPIGKTVYYLVCLDAAGTVYTIQGTYVGQSFTPYSNRLGDGKMPCDIGSTLTPIGYIKVVTGSATFTPATTLLDAANITFTFGDLSAIPSTDP